MDTGYLPKGSLVLGIFACMARAFTGACGTFTELVY